MPCSPIVHDVRYGRSYKSTQPLHMELCDFSTDPAGRIRYRVVITGPIAVDKPCSADSLFSAVVVGLAGLRQCVRHLLKADPALKLFEEFDGKLVRRSVDDLFLTHDCVPEDPPASALAEP